MTPAVLARSASIPLASFDLPPMNCNAVFNDVPASEPRMPFFANAARTAFMLIIDGNPPSTARNVFENENAACCIASDSSAADDPDRIDATANASATFSVSFAPILNTFTPAATAFAAVSASVPSARDNARTARPDPPNTVVRSTPDTASWRNACAASTADTPGSFASLPNWTARSSKRASSSAVGFAATRNSAIAEVKSDATFNVLRIPPPTPTPPATGRRLDSPPCPVAVPSTPEPSRVCSLVVNAARSLASRRRMLRRDNAPRRSTPSSVDDVRRASPIRRSFAERSSVSDLRAHVPTVRAISRPPLDATVVNVR